MVARLLLTKISRLHANGIVDVVGAAALVVLNKLRWQTKTIRNYGQMYEISKWSGCHFNIALISAFIGKSIENESNSGFSPNCYLALALPFIFALAHIHTHFLFYLSCLRNLLSIKLNETVVTYLSTIDSIMHIAIRSNRNQKAQFNLHWQWHSIE